jgi:hypothetical protein
MNAFSIKRFADFKQAIINFMIHILCFLSLIKLALTNPELLRKYDAVVLSQSLV